MRISAPPALPQKKRRSTQTSPFPDAGSRVLYERYPSQYDNLSEEERNPTPPFPLLTPISPMPQTNGGVFVAQYTASESTDVPASPPPLPEKKSKHSKRGERRRSQEQKINKNKWGRKERKILKQRYFQEWLRTGQWGGHWEHFIIASLKNGLCWGIIEKMPKINTRMCYSDADTEGNIWSFPDPPATTLPQKPVYYVISSSLFSDKLCIIICNYKAVVL